jgi:hypothetical protein
MSRELRAVLLAFLTPLSACLSYTPIGTTTPARGAEVEATVAPLDARVGEITVHGVTRVDGRVAFADNDSLVIVARRFLSETGTEYRSIGDAVTIQHAQLLSMKRRRLSAWKTGLAVGLTGAAVGAVIAGVGPLSGFGGSGRPKPQP